MFSPNDILRTDGLNTVTFSDPYARLCFTTMIAGALTQSSLDNKNSIHKRVLYIDTDTVFTAYLAAGLIIKDNYQTSKDISYNHRNKNESREYYYQNNFDNKQQGDENTNDSRITISKRKNKDKRLVQVFLPSEGRFESLLGNAIASMPEASIVIFDSLNGFYNMYPTPWYESEIVKQPPSKKKEADENEAQGSGVIYEPPWKLRENQQKRPSTYTSIEEENINLSTQQRSPGEKEDRLEQSVTIKPTTTTSNTTKSPYTVGRLNHLLSVYVMLLVQHGLFYKIPVLVTSMVRYKRVSEDVWIKAPACRRLLNQKSVVRLSVEMLNENDLSMNIMKHPSLDQQTIIYRDVGISLISP